LPKKNFEFNSWLSWRRSRFGACRRTLHDFLALARIDATPAQNVFEMAAASHAEIVRVEATIANAR